MFWQCPNKSHSFLSTSDITFIQITWGIILPYRSRRKTVSVHVSALISPSPGWEEDNVTETSGAFVIVVWAIKTQRKRTWSSILLKCIWQWQAGLVSSSVPTSEDPDPSRMLLSHPQLIHEHKTITATFVGCTSTAVPMLQLQIPSLCGLCG